MFEGSKRSVSNPSLTRSDSSKCSSGATRQEFQKAQSQNNFMASAAAASALRSRPSSPVLVSDVTTKLMIRRNSSASSNGSNLFASRDLQPERRKSSGSMSQRSFRNSGSVSSQMIINTPPLPPLPNFIHKDMSKNTMNVASRRQKIVGRTSSLDCQGLTVSTNQPSMENNQKSSGRTPSIGRGSINFSLPTDSRPNSPIGPRRLNSQLMINQTGKFVSSDKNVRLDKNPQNIVTGFDFSIPKQRLGQDSIRQTKKKSITQSQDKKASFLLNTNLGKEFKDQEIMKYLEIEKASIVPVKNSSMSLDAFSTSENSSMLKYKDENEHSDRPSTYTFNYLDVLKSNSPLTKPSIDVNQSNFLAQNQSRQCSISSNNNAESQSLTHSILEKKNPSLLSSLLTITDNEQTVGQALDSINSIDNQYTEDKYSNPLSQVNQDSKEACVINFEKDNLGIVKESFTSKRTLQLPLNMARPYDMNHSTSKNKYPSEFPPKYMQSSRLTFGSGEECSEILSCESISERLNQLKFDEKDKVGETESSPANEFTGTAEPYFKRDCESFDIEESKVRQSVVQRNEAIKLRPKSSSLESLRDKNVYPEAQDFFFLKSMEKNDYTSLPASPTLHAYPSQKKYEVKTNANIKIHPKGACSDVENSASPLIFHEQPVIDIKSLDKKSIEIRKSELAMKNSHASSEVINPNFDQRHINRKFTLKNSLKILRVDTSPTHLTFLDTPTSGYSSNSNHTLTSTTSNFSGQSRNFHVPGAWESPIGSFKRSLELGLQPNIEPVNSKVEYVSQSLISNTLNSNSNETHTIAPEAFELTEGNLGLVNKLKVSQVEENSEAGSIYCDALENICPIDVNCTESSTISTVISTRIEADKEKDMNRLEPMMAGSIIQTTLQRTSKLDSDLTDEVPNPIKSELTHSWKPDDSLKQEPINTYRHHSSSLAASVQIKTKENQTKNLSNGKLKIFSNNLVFDANMQLRPLQRLGSGDTVSSFKRAQLIPKELKLKSSMRRPGKSQIDGRTKTSFRSVQFNIRSSSPASITSHRSAIRKASPALVPITRKSSKFSLSRIASRHPLWSTSEKTLVKSPSNLKAPSDDGVANNSKLLNTQKLNGFQKISNSQINALIDRSVLTSDKDRDLKTLIESKAFVPSLSQTAETIPCEGIEKNVSSLSPNLPREPPYKQKEKFLSILRKKKVTTSDKVRSSYKQKPAIQTSQNTNNHSPHTTKHPIDPLHFPKRDAKEIIPWPLPTPLSTNDQISEANTSSHGNRTKREEKANSSSMNGARMHLDTSKKKSRPLKRILRLD